MPSITRGYDPEFTGITLKLPTIPAGVCAPLKQGTGEEIKYIHYSSFLHKERNLPLLCASNIKGESYNAPNRAGVEPWDYSDQVLNSYQLDEAFYGNDQNTFDRGHIVRRVDPCWGDAAIAAQAEIETFRWSNCTPQHKKLNQKGGVWYQLEQYVMENGAKGKVADLSVFAGPILSKDDKYMLLKKGKYKGQYIQIPIEFFKIIVWKKSDNKLYAVGFLMSQWEFIKDKMVDKPVPAKPVKKAVSKPRLKDDYFENLKFADHKTYQVPIAVIVEKTGIKFNWSHVIFPYKATDAQTIEAVPNSKKGLRSVRGTSANSAATKQYDLKNITL